MLDFDYVAIREVTAAGAEGERFLLNAPGGSYALVRYRPAVASRRAGSLAGQSTYTDVVDTITVHVLGDTVGAAQSALERLVGIIDQAGEWWSGEDTSMVEVRVRVRDPGAVFLSATILGPPEGDEPVSYDPEFDTPVAPGRWVIQNVELRFIRRGRWLADRESVTLPASTGNPTVETITWADSQGRVRAPAGIELDISVGSVANNIDGALLITADDAGAVQFSDITTWSYAPPFTSVAAATSRPYQGTNLIRLTPAAANTDYAAISIASGLIGTSRLLGFWLCLKGGGSVDWLITLNFYQYVAALTTVVRSTPPVVYQGSSNASYIPLGFLAISGQQNVGSEVELVFRASSVAGGPTLDLSHLVIVKMDAPGLNIVNPQLTGDNDGLAALPAEILNAGRAGVVQSSATPSFADSLVAQSYSGDMEITTAGGSLAVAYLSTQGSAFTTGNSTTKANYTFTGYRRRAALTPYLAQAPPASGGLSRAELIASLSPLAWWRLDEAPGSTTAADSSGNGYTGSVVGTVTFGTYGGRPGASTAGGANYIQANLGTDFNWNSYTVVSWVFGTCGGNVPLIFSSEGTVQMEPEGTSCGNYYFIVRLGALVTVNGINNDGWRLVASTYDGATLRAYGPSGAEIGSAADATVATITATTIQIGEFTIGQYADVVLFNGVLTPEQIAALAIAEV